MKIDIDQKKEKEKEKLVRVNITFGIDIPLSHIEDEKGKSPFEITEEASLLNYLRQNAFEGDSDVVGILSLLWDWESFHPEEVTDLELRLLES